LRDRALRRLDLRRVAKIDHLPGESTITQLKRLSTFILMLVLASVLGCASTPTQEGTGEYFDDSAITAKVKGAVLNEPTLKSAEINV